MQNELQLLRNLQKFDLEIQEIEEKNETLRETLDELYEMHEVLTEALDDQRRQLDEASSLMRNKEVDLRVNDERLAQSRSRLTQIQNTREYNLLEKEMDTLKKLRATLEEEHDRLKETVAEFEDDVTEKESKIRQLADQIKDEEGQIEKQTSQSVKRVEELTKKREQLKKDLPKPLVRRYEFISTRRAGEVAVPARDGICTGCNMSLPPQLYNEVQLGQRLIQCPSCQRILFHESEEEREAATAN